MTNSTYQFDKYFRASNSSAVSEVRYNSSTFELFVTLVSGNIYRYTAVPGYVFAKFTAPGASAGSVYSNYVRNRYTSERISSYSIFKDVNERTGGYGFRTAATPPKSEFEVVVQVDGRLTIKGEADNVSDALAKVQEVLSETFEGKSKVLELKQKFE